jgi:DNA helicase-2/ATP-dependent DNA helicase PcrA
MEKISFKSSLEEIKKTKEKIGKTASEIRESNFNPNVGPWCDFCAFRMICEAWQ